MVDTTGSAPGARMHQSQTWSKAGSSAVGARHDDGHSAPRVLIVDDSAFARYSLRKLLVEHGFDVVEAADGGPAVEAYATSSPDAVLLDITMPGMDGLSALKAIRQIDPGARVAMVTGMGQQTIVIEAIKSGAMDFIVKPFQADRVLAALQKLLATR